MKLAWCLLAVACIGAKAQDAVVTSALPARPQVSFAFSRVGLPVPKYTLTINRDGSGAYQGEALIGVATRTSPFSRQVMVSQATVTRIFKLSEELKHFNKVCASKAKNIADTGTKTLKYAGADATGSCTYNYTENKDVQALTDIFQAIAETMDMGRQLDHLHRYDRLGLDEAMTSLAQEVASGRALEIGTIAPSLNSIASDAEVMERVRTKAKTLLAQVPAGQSTTSFH